MTYISLLEHSSPVKCLAEIYVTHLWSPGRMYRGCLTKGVRVPITIGRDWQYHCDRASVAVEVRFVIWRVIG